MCDIDAASNKGVGVHIKIVVPSNDFLESLTKHFGIPETCINTYVNKIIMDLNWQLTVSEIEITYSENDHSSLHEWFRMARTNPHKVVGFSVDGEVVVYLRLRFSRINRPFLQYKDIIVQMIEAKYKRQGLGTLAVLALLEAAESIGRGVQLQSVEAKAWADSLVAHGLFYADDESLNYYSIIPIKDATR